MPKSVLKFQNNAPVEIALAFAQGWITRSTFGADEVKYTLAHLPDHITFVDLTASQKINQPRATQGERLVICKRKGAGRNSPVRWIVSLAPSAEMSRAAAEAGVPLKENGRRAAGSRPRRLAANSRHARLRRSGATRMCRAARAPVVADPESMLARQLRASVAEADGKKAVAPHVITKLEHALKTAVAAAFAATEYAKTIGYGGMPQFTSEDIRTMAGTLIDAGKRQ